VTPCNAASAAMQPSQPRKITRQLANKQGTVDTMTSPDSERPELSDEQLRAQMYAEAEAAAAVPFDDDDGSPLPPHVKVSRPNRTAADYEAMSREIEAGEHIPVGPIESRRPRSSHPPPLH